MKSACSHLRSSRFVKDERGVTAVEFGLLAVPFFAILGAILETALIFLAGQLLDAAVSDAARRVKTGEAQMAGMSIEGFRGLVCNRLYGMFDCPSLRVNVKTFDGFSVVTIPPPLKPDCNPSVKPCEWNIDNAFGPGEGQEVVLVQVYYKWPTIVNFGGFGLADQPDGTRLLAGVDLFRNEPF